MERFPCNCMCDTTFKKMNECIEQIEKMGLLGINPMSFFCDAEKGISECPAKDSCSIFFKRNR
ncbi:MAG: hypothetical protein ACOCQR_02965 [bacterium]